MSGTCARPGWATRSCGCSSISVIEVVRAAHLGDWGTQFGMLIEHALEVGEQATYDQLAAGEFTDFYQAANERFRL